MKKSKQETRSNTSGVHVWLVFMKAYQALHRYASQSIQGTNLCLSDFVALEMLLHKGPQPINAIVEKLGLTSGALTASIDRLEKKGYVERHFDAEDRRIRIIHLTPSGKELIETSFNQHAQDMEIAIENLTPEERETLILLLKKAGKAPILQ